MSTFPSSVLPFICFQSFSKTSKWLRMFWGGEKTKQTTKQWWLEKEKEGKAWVTVIYMVDQRHSSYWSATIVHISCDCIGRVWQRLHSFCYTCTTTTFVRCNNPLLSSTWVRARFVFHMTNTAADMSGSTIIYILQTVVCFIFYVPYVLQQKLKFKFHSQNFYPLRFWLSWLKSKHYLTSPDKDLENSCFVALQFFWHLL